MLRASTFDASSPAAVASELDVLLVSQRLLTPVASGAGAPLHGNSTIAPPHEMPELRATAGRQARQLFSGNTSRERATNALTPYIVPQHANKSQEIAAALCPTTTTREIWCCPAPPRKTCLLYNSVRVKAWRGNFQRTSCFRHTNTVVLCVSVPAALTTAVLHYAFVLKRLSNRTRAWRETKSWLMSDAALRRSPLATYVSLIIFLHTTGDVFPAWHSGSGGTSGFLVVAVVNAGGAALLRSVVLCDAKLVGISLRRFCWASITWI